MINVCHAGCLLYALYGICHQYSTDISAWLDNDWNYFSWIC